MGVGGVAEQLSAAGPQLQRSGDCHVVVGRPSSCAAVDEHPPDPLPKVAAVGVGEEGLDARTRVGNGPASLLPAGLCSLGGGVAEGLWQAGQFGGVVKKNSALVLVAEQVLAERGGKRRQFSIEPREFCLGLWSKLCAVADEVGVGQPGDPLLLDGEL